MSYDPSVVNPYITYRVRRTNTERVIEVHVMSGALWCDKGEHAFSAKDPGAEHYTRKIRKKQDGFPVEVTEEFDLCGTHANPFQETETEKVTPPKAINGTIE